jgi:aspartyl-tRNA(Asn)/glutamyl-tRNA(Gln) amidotransferase subunit A
MSTERLQPGAAGGDASCVERIEAAIAAIEDVQRRCNAFTTVRDDSALAEATALDARSASERGPLHGVPVVVKELFDVAGLPTTGGCAAYAGNLASTDAAIVQRLVGAGAVVVAKANQHELGAGATGLVSGHGGVANPIDPARIAGGSSSGSAVAVAAGVVPLAVGSDTGGSIRIPASFCGVTGLRPTPGRVSLAGAQAMSPGYDTAGPLAGTARECAIAFAVTARQAVPVAELDDLRGIRVGLPEPFFDLVHPATRAAVEAAASALESLGATVERTAGPDIDATFAGFRHVWADVAVEHRAIWDRPDVSDEVAALIRGGRELSGLEYAESRAAAHRVREDFAEWLERVDVLLTPATPYPAPPADVEEVAVEGGVLDVHRGAPSRLTVPVNEAGVPALAFPVGTSAEGLPLGAQLIGRPQADESILAIVTTLQERGRMG